MASLASAALTTGRAAKMSPPRYQNLEGPDVTLLSSDDGGSLVRLIAGDLQGHRGPGATHTPISVVHATVSAGARLTLRAMTGLQSEPERLAFRARATWPAAGSGDAGPERPLAGAGPRSGLAGKVAPPDAAEAS